MAGKLHPATLYVIALLHGSVKVASLNQQCPSQTECCIENVDFVVKIECDGYPLPQDLYIDFFCECLTVGSYEQLWEKMVKQPFGKLHSARHQNFFWFHFENTMCFLISQFANLFTDYMQGRWRGCGLETNATHQSEKKESLFSGGSQQKVD